MLASARHTVCEVLHILHKVSVWLTGVALTP
jgi:hypothetical protein